jgi:hydroxymethylpyrimidine pyrophosphatase-like HAD family hydrolase
MRYFALACDYDGTIAHEGIVSASTIEALKRFRESGRRPILVTGRQLDELLQVFPEFEIFDRVVADNGGVLYSPATRETKILADPPPPEFLEALLLRRVPFSVGQVIIGTVEPYDATVLEIIKELGLELQVIYNKGSVMILPSGVNKSSGLARALAELGLSENNTVAIGDAENDHALLGLCGIGVAVANAIPTLKERADLVTTLADGSGVEELIERILHDDLTGIQPRKAARQIVLGKRTDGKRKYADGELPPDRSFYFKGPEGKLNLRAQNLNMFIQLAQGVDDETWLHHLHQRDYSRWMRETTKDADLVEEVSAIENAGAASSRDSRAGVIEAINKRYTASE